jgi:hypothetical protein
MGKIKGKKATGEINICISEVGGKYNFWLEGV